jgi:hypothetical protein
MRIANCRSASNDAVVGGRTGRRGTRRDLHRDPQADGMAGWRAAARWRRGRRTRLSSSASPLSAGSGRRSPAVPAIVTGHGSPAGPVRRSGGSPGRGGQSRSALAPTGREARCSQSLARVVYVTSSTIASPGPGGIAVASGYGSMIRSSTNRSWNRVPRSSAMATPVGHAWPVIRSTTTCRSWRSTAAG